MFDPLGKARNWPGTTVEPKPEKHERFDYSALEEQMMIFFLTFYQKYWILDFCMHYLTWKRSLMLN